MGSALTLASFRTELNWTGLRTPSWCWRIAWCMENSHIWCQKYCECGSIMRVKKKHRRNVFFYLPGKYKSLKLIQEEIDLNSPITTNRLYQKWTAPHKDSSQPRRFQRWALPCVQRKLRLHDTKTFGKWNGALPQLILISRIYRQSYKLINKNWLNGKKIGKDMNRCYTKKKYKWHITTSIDNREIQTQNSRYHFTPTDIPA